MVEPIFVAPIFAEYILPFVLVFTLVFAILEKSNLLGEEKRQINAILGLVVGMILLAFPFAKNIIIQLMPFLAVSVVILFVFMLLYGFIMGNKDGDVLHKGVKITFAIILGIGLVAILLFASGFWDLVYNMLFQKEGSSQIWINVLLFIVIAGAVAAVVATKEK